MIVFDELHLDPAEAARARAAIADFLATGVSDGDRVALVGTAQGTRWTARLPEGQEALRQALDRLQPGLVGETVRDRMSDWEAMRIDRDRDPLVTDVVMRRYLDTGEIDQDTASPGNRVLPQSDEVASWRDDVRSRAAFVYARAADRNEQALGVVARSLAALAAERGRKSIVFASGGMIQDPRLSIYREVVNEARRVNAAVYFLDARGLSAATTGMSAEVGTRTEFRDLGSWFTEARERGEGSEGLAADTGGFSLRDRNDLAAGLARIGRESRSYYLLGYTPAKRKADGRFRKIEVKVARDGVAVRARRGYYAPGGDGSRKAAAEGRDAAFQRALDAPFDLADVPLRAIADVLGPAEPGQASVRLTVEADVRAFAFAEKGGTARDTLEFLLLVAREDTGEFTRFDQQFEMSLRPESRARYEREGFPITRDLALAPGKLPGAHRGPRRQRRGGRKPSPRLRGPGPRGAPRLEPRPGRSTARPGAGRAGGARADGTAAVRRLGGPALPVRGVRGGDGRRHRQAERDRGLLDPAERRALPRGHGGDPAPGRPGRDPRPRLRRPPRRCSGRPLRDDRGGHRRRGGPDGGGAGALRDRGALRLTRTGRRRARRGCARRRADPGRGGATRGTPRRPPSGPPPPSGSGRGR